MASRRNTDAPSRKSLVATIHRGGVPIGLAAVVLAGALPVTALLVASGRATRAVENSTISGATATANAVAAQAGQKYRDARAALTRAGRSPTVLAALRARDHAVGDALMTRILAAGSSRAAGLYDSAGNLVASASDEGAQVPPLGSELAGDLNEGPVETVGTTSSRRITAKVRDASGQQLGTIVADVDLAQLIANPLALRFGATGVSVLVGIDGRVLIHPIYLAIGKVLPSPVNRRLAHDHEARHVITVSPLSHQRVVEAYVPVAGQPWGVLTQQATTEAFAGAIHLSRVLHALALGFALLGVALAAAVMLMVARRNRRITGQTADLAAAQALFHSAFDNAPTGIGLVGLDGNYLEVNRALSQITGYSQAELLKRTPVDLTHPEDIDATVALNRRLFTGEVDGYDQESRYLHADGNVVWVRLRTSLVRDVAGRPSHSIGHVVDVTQQHLASETLQHALRREQEAVDQMRLLDETKSDLLAAVSHDFRTPLTAIVGFGSMLEDRWEAFDDDTRRDMIGRIVLNGEELGRRVTNFLDYTRLESGTMQLDVTPIALAGAVEAAIARTQLVLEGHVVQSRVVGDAWVMADDTALARVLENLLTNAAKYSPTGSTIDISADRQDHRFVITVADAGEGVADVDRERIFDRFYRASRGRGAPRGTGIGLAAVKQLVGLMDGHVWVAPRPEGGSAFSVALRAAPLMAVAHAPAGES